MTVFNLTCPGPGPHLPASGVLGTSSSPTPSGMFCPSPACQAAFLSAQTAAANLQANAATIQANIQTHLGQIETWLAANPNGAILTAGQTAQLARMLVGIGRILLALTETIGQAA